MTYGKWELEKVLKDEHFKMFIIELYKCTSVVRIWILGSLTMKGYEDLDQTSQGKPFIDVDVGLEISDVETDEIIDSGELSRFPSDLASCLIKYGYDNYSVWVKSPNAPDNPIGRQYEIHIEDRPISRNICLMDKASEDGLYQKEKPFEWLSKWIKENLGE